MVIVDHPSTLVIPGGIAMSHRKVVLCIATALVLAGHACTAPTVPPASAPLSEPLATGTSAQVEAIAVSTAQPGKIPTQHVTFKSGDLTLEGYLYKPDGNGPFPLVIWNHGSEQDPRPDVQFASVANVYVPAGYVVFAPVRRGQGNSEGEYISDQVSAETKKNGKIAGEKLFVQLIAGAQVDDQLAGLAYAMSLPYIDQSRIVVSGCSFGGMQTLFGAERGAYKAAVAISPGAESWDGHALLQARMIQAVDSIKVPVLIIHPEKDASVEPGYALGQEFQKLGKPYGLFIFPPYGTDQQQGHCFGGQGADFWGPVALQFLEQVLH
jgi:dipeptidyl aminopeptidase/acylaminoacyl peptidase